MTPDHDDLEAGLRQIAQRLDQQSRPADARSAMQRPVKAQPVGRRPLALAAAVAVVVAAGALVAAQVADEGTRSLRTTGRPSTTAAADPAPAVPTTSPDAPGGTSYVGTPFEELPASGIAIVEGDRLVLLGHDGRQLGEAPSAEVSQLGARPGRDTVAVRPGLVEVAGPDPAEAPSDCEAASGGGGVRVALCGGDEQRRVRVVRIDATGRTSVLAERAPGSQGVGHWRWAVPSPDGRWVLAQWSGECEVPTAFLLPTTGGEVRTVAGEAAVGGALESTGVGWAPDGRAIVRFHGGLCGTGAEEPGTYLVDPVSTRRQLLRPEPAAASSTWEWTREPYGNVREHTFLRAIRELGLESCCGEPSHGGASARAGVQWHGIDVPVLGAPKSAPAHVPFNDQVIASRPIEIDGAPATAGEADLGPFVSFTCGADVWAIGGTGAGERATAEAVRALAAALVPRLYCTVGERPMATGHGEG